MSLCEITLELLWATQMPIPAAKTCPPSKMWLLSTSVRLVSATSVRAALASPTRMPPAPRSFSSFGLSAIIGSLVPIAPFLFLPIGTSMIVSVAVTALVLFLIGAYKARVTIGRPARSGVEMAVIGTLSALAGYLVGILLKVPGGV